jgi:hypothetical protein
MIKSPTADDVAVAIIAACRETKEDPIEVATRAPARRARHYAAHALANQFPDVLRERIADMVGCPGKGIYFWRNSCGQVANPNGLGRYTVKWWDAAVYRRVIEAIKAAAMRVEPDRRPRPRADVYAVTKLAPGFVTRDLPPAPQKRPRQDFQPTAYVAPGKRELNDILAEAVRNTANIKPEKDS